MERVMAFLKSKRYTKNFINAETRNQFKKYLVVGFSSFGLDYGLFALFVKVFNVYYLYANIFIYIFVFWFNYILNRCWSFQSKEPLRTQLKKYFLLFIFNLLAANVILIYFLTDIIGIPEMISKILIMGAVVSWNFILYKKVIYK